MAWLRSSAWSEAQLADAVGVYQQTISRYCLGDIRPGPTIRDRFEVVCGIQPRAWMTDTERAREKEVLRRRAA